MVKTKSQERDLPIHGKLSRPDQKAESSTGQEDFVSQAGSSVKKRASKVAKRVEEEVKPRLRIKIRAYDHKVIDKSAKQIVETALRYGADVSGPTPLPTETHKYTVNRSSFIHKDAREQFEMRVHKRLIDILNPNPKVIDALMNLILPAGVDIEIKM